MTKEDVKTVNKELIKRDLLDEYGNNSLKIEELEKELKDYKYNKVGIASAYGAGFISMITTTSLVATGVIPIIPILAIPAIGLSSTLIGVGTEKGINRLLKSNNKFSLFQKEKKRTKTLEEKLTKELQLEKLKTRNDIINKAIDILKTKDICITQKEIKDKKLENDFNELDSLIARVTLSEKIDSSSFSMKTITPESKYISVLGFSSFAGLAVFPIPALTSAIANVLYNIGTTISNASVFSSIMLTGINNSKKESDKKTQIIKENDLILKDKSLVNYRKLSKKQRNDLNNNYDSNPIYIYNEEYKTKELEKDLKRLEDLIDNIAYKKVEILEQQIIEKVMKKNQEKENDKAKKYIKNYYKLKEISINRKNANHKEIEEVKVLRKKKRFV